MQTMTATPTAAANEQPVTPPVRLINLPRACDVMRGEALDALVEPPRRGWVRLLM